MPRPRLRITHVIPQIGIGGAETQLCHLISGTPADRAEHRVLFYADSHDEEGFRLYESAGVRLSRVARSRACPPLFLWRLASAIREGRPDIVHCWLPGAAFWGRWAAILAGVDRIVLSIRSSVVWHAWILQVSRFADGRGIRYLVNSPASGEAAARLIGAPRDRITVIPNGTDLEQRIAPLRREALLQEHGCPADAKIVLSVGRLTELKNYPMLVRIAARFRGRLPIHFFVAGHGELEASLKDLARHSGVADTVHFLGLRRDVPALLRTADVFCYTSRSEGLPNALLEAMAAARPIVTTRFAAMETLVESGRTGLVVDQDDDLAASEAVRRLLEDTSLARSLGAAARRSAEERFGMKRMVEATLAYYDRLMEAG